MNPWQNTLRLCTAGVARVGLTSRTVVCVELGGGCFGRENRFFAAPCVREALLTTDNTFGCTRVYAESRFGSTQRSFHTLCWRLYSKNAFLSVWL